jgi:hypothetical protein
MPGNVVFLAAAAAAGTSHSQQATRHARRVYVGGLPPTAGEQSVSTFFSHALAAVGGNTAGPGAATIWVFVGSIDVCAVLRQMLPLGPQCLGCCSPRTANARACDVILMQAA